MRSMNPLVTVIVPTRDNATTLHRAVASILHQSLRDLECIVIDDGSREDTGAVLADCRRDKRFRTIRLETNQGRGAARNAGVEVANGKYIAWQDADDASHPLRLERQVRFLEDSPVTGIVGSGAYVEMNAGRILIANCVDREPTLLGPNEEPPLLFPTSMIRHEVLDAHRFDPRYRTAEDFDFQMRAMRSHRYANIAEPLYAYSLVGRFDLVKYASSQWTRNSVLYRDIARRQPWSFAARSTTNLAKIGVYAVARLMGFESQLIDRRFKTPTVEQLAEYRRFVEDLPAVESDH